jgi:hypothetical protein
LGVSICGAGAQPAGARAGNASRHRAREREYGIDPVSIGSLNESPLHRALKDWYASPGARQEVALEGFVADLVDAQARVVEIQTGGFGRIRRKLSVLLENHRVLLVHPIPAVRYIHWPIAPDDDRPRKPRRSPRRGVLADVLRELVSVPKLLDHPGFELEVVLVAIDEFRAPAVRRGRETFRVVERRLVDVMATLRLCSSLDLFALLQSALPDPFSTADVAAALGAGRRLGQQWTYCLRQAGRIEPVGKSGNAILYRRVNSFAET